jgi:hypothetical protein
MVSVGTHTCNSLIFVWSNVNEIKRILNSHQAPNTWEVSQTKPNQTKGFFMNLENQPPTRTKGFYL